MACNLDDCNLQVFEDEEYCVLHCIKGSYSEDFHRLNVLSDFFEKFRNHIISKISVDQLTRFQQFEITEYLENSEPESSEVATLFNHTKINCSDIKFPGRDDRDPFDYLKILNRIGSIHFLRCSFQGMRLDLPKTRVFFNNCIFYENWWISDYRLLVNVNNVIYQDCKFNEGVVFASISKEEYIVSNDQFLNCDLKTVEIENAIFKGKLFCNAIAPQEIERVTIKNSSFEDKLLLNDLVIHVFKISDSEIKSKFEFKNSVVHSQASIENCNFSEVTDFFGSNLNNFSMKKCIASSFVGFESCEFDSGTGRPTEFEYVTFESFINYRGANFKSGLDLSTINMRQDANFYKCRVEPNNTNRETYRIIKNSLDRVGNHIEANIFYREEMSKYRKELKLKKGHSKEKLIFGLNKLISDYGQNYWRPIKLTILTAILFALIVNGYNNNVLYKIYPAWNDGIECVSSNINIVAKSILPFKSILKEGMEFLSLIFYLILSGFIWHTIVALKRHAKR